MRPSRCGWLLTVLLFAGAVIALPARATIYQNGITRDELRAVLIAWGAQVQERPEGFWRVSCPARSGVQPCADPIYLSLEQCRGDACAEIWMFVTLKNVRPTLEAVNNWNHYAGIPEASIAEDGSLTLKSWTTTIGATDRLIENFIGWFGSAIKDDDFVEFWKPYMSGPSV